MTDIHQQTIEVPYYAIWKLCGLAGPKSDKIEKKRKIGLRGNLKYQNKKGMYALENNDTHKQDTSTSTSGSSIPSAADLVGTFDEVTTARLVLRRVQVIDGPAIFRVHGDPATNLYNPYGPHADLATSEVMLRECLDHWEAYGFGIWAVTRAQEEEVIGFGGVEHQIWRARDVLNLYYRFTPGAWGQGYASELARTAVTLAQTYLPAWPVIARVRARNTPSIRTAERAGLVRRPDLDTEHMVFALG